MRYYVYNVYKSVVICSPKLSDHFSRSMAQVAQVEPTKVRAATFSKPEYEAHLTGIGWSLKLGGSIMQNVSNLLAVQVHTSNEGTVLLTSEGKQNGHCF